MRSNRAGVASVGIAWAVLTWIVSFGVGIARPENERPAVSRHATGSASADAAALYNAGTRALERGDLGPAVLLLSAARRLDPRAADIRANLASALDRAARARGEEDRPERPGPAFVSVKEGWWGTSALLAAGALLGIFGATRGRVIGPRARPFSVAGAALIGVGLLGFGLLQIQAWEESAHPEAVVLAPALSVERGPEEASRPAVLLSAGERVRLGSSRGGLVEVRIGGNVIGWAARGGLWLVSDAARYTSGG